MERRKFIKGLSVLGIGSFLTGLYSSQIEPNWLEFTKHKMAIKKLPIHLEGKTIMQISDIHASERVGAEFIIKSLIKAKQYQPDFVFYTGDFISCKSEKDYSILETTLPYFVKGKLGTLGVLGNHDYGENYNSEVLASRVCKSLKENDIEVLRNENKKIAGLNIIGIDDYWSTNFYPDKAMLNFNKEEATLVLCHNPDTCDLDIWNNYNGWILSGHTHGGQCKAPFLPPFILPVKNKKYTSGKINLANNRTLYINRALGHSFKLRFNVRPEISIFKLTTT